MKTKTTKPTIGTTTTEKGKKKSITRKQLEKELRIIKAQNNPFLDALVETTNFQKLVNLFRKTL